MFVIKTYRIGSVLNLHLKYGLGGPRKFRGTTFYFDHALGGPVIVWYLVRGSRKFLLPWRGVGNFCITHNKKMSPKRLKKTFLHVLAQDVFWVESPYEEGGV